MHKRANKHPTEEELAADRQGYPANNFPLTASMVGGLIVLIAIAVAAGWLAR